MRSPAEASSAAVGRSSDLLDQVDYRLAQDARRKRRNLQSPLPGLSSRGRGLPNIPSSASPINTTTCPIPGHSASSVHGELYSSVRISVLTPEWRESCSAEAFGEILHPRLDRGEVIIDPARFVADPDKAKRFPELPYVTLRLAYMACEYFNADIGLAIVRAEHQAFYRRVFLHETIAEPTLLPGPAQAGRIDGGGFPGDAREGL